jgi:hypothetical protein
VGAEVNVSILMLAACGMEFTLAGGEAPVTVAGVDEVDVPSGGVGAAGEVDTGSPVEEVAAAAGEADPVAPCDAWGEPSAVGTLPMGMLEASGVAASSANPGVVWVIQDSGHEAVVYGLDIDGSVLTTVTVAGATNRDWEDVAVGPCDEGVCVWVADIGDNDRVRTDAALYRFVEPELGVAAAESMVVDAVRVPVMYPEGPQNAESLAVTPDGRAVIVTKREDGSADVFRVEGAGLAALGRIDVSADGDLSPGQATAADLWPDGSRMLVRTYGHAFEFDLGEGGVDDVSAAARSELPAFYQPQVEAMAYDPALRGVWQTSEGEGQALVFAGCEE